MFLLTVVCSYLYRFSYIHLDFIVWRNIEAAILEYMVGVRRMYLKRTRTLVLRSRTAKAASIFLAFKEALPPHTLFPYIPDSLAWDVVYDLIHRPDHNALTEEDFTEVLSEMDSFADNWCYSIHHRLAEGVGLTFVEPHPDIHTLSADLKLAAIGVICASCTHFLIDFSQSAVEEFLSAKVLRLKPLFYPEVLTHKCAVRGLRFPGGRDNHFLVPGAGFRSSARRGRQSRTSNTLVDAKSRHDGWARPVERDRGRYGRGVMFECGVCQDRARRVLFSWHDIVGSFLSFSIFVMG